MQKLMLILLFAFTSCSKNLEKQAEKEISNTILVQKMPENLPNFRFLRRDDSLNAALIIRDNLFVNHKANSIDFYDIGFLTNCDCMLDSNVLKIKLSDNGGWVYKDLKLEISDKLKAKRLYATDIHFETSSPQYVKLELSNLKPSISDTIFGKILTIYDTIYRQVRIREDTALIDIKRIEKYLGFFRCMVRKAQKEDEQYWIMELNAF